MTKLNYLENTYLFKSNATVLETKESEKGKAIILDETIFYPQGGGQPADTGEITSDNAIFTVTDVRLDENGTVWHFGEFKKGELQKGDKVILKIEEEKRILSAKAHSAGHLLDCIIGEMNLDLKPGNGYHFPHAPYIEYKGIIENKEEMISKLENEATKLIEKDLEVNKQNLSYEEAKAKGIWAPPGKSARIVNFTGFSNWGCGGTHIKSTSEIKKITIRKIKSRKGITRISYAIQ